MHSRLSHTLFGVAAITIASASSAALVTSTDRVLLHFDFSAQSPAPPYRNINFQLYTSANNDINAGESFTIQAFDSTSSALSNALHLQFVADTGGGMESGFGGPMGSFYGTLTVPTGYLELTNIGGSFDLVSAKVIAANLSFFPPGTQWIDATVQVVTIPEPTTYSLALIAGLLTLGTKTRRASPGRQGDA